MTNETAATGGVMITDEGELEFDEDEIAALEGQRLVAEFTRCTRWPGQPSIIDPVMNAANVKKALTLTLTTIFCRCQQTVQLPLVSKPIQLKQTTSPKTVKKFFKENYLTTMYFVLCIVCCVVYCLLCITVLCCANNHLQIFSKKFIYFLKNIKIYFV